jgi:hypothetical protein
MLHVAGNPRPCMLLVANTRLRPVPALHLVPRLRHLTRHRTRPYSYRLLRRILRDPLWPVLLVMILRPPLNKHRHRHPLLMLRHNDHLLHVFKLDSNKVYGNPKNTLMVRCAMDCFLPQVNHLHFLRLLILLNGAKLWRRNIML